MSIFKPIKPLATFVPPPVNRDKFLLYYFLGFFISLIGCASTSAIGQNTMNSKTKCDISPVQRSQEMIRTILDDITKNYTHTGGGGITEIRQSATDTYVVLIAQEERIDQITYDMGINQNCKTTINKRKVSAISPH